MFERFTQAARRAVVLAQEEARQQGSPTIGVGHLLFGVLSDTTAAPAVVLQRYGVDATRVAAATDAGTLDADALSTLGIDLDEVRRQAEAEFGAGALDPSSRSRWNRRMTKGHIPFTPEAKGALAEALRAAVTHGDREIGSAQLFLGLLTDPTVTTTLRGLGAEVSPTELTRQVRAELDQAA